MGINTKELAKQIFELVGGKENIVTYTHCATRLRFSLVDHKAAQKKELENLSGITAVIESGGQFQVVIGPQVLEVYQELQKILPLSDDVKIKRQKKGVITGLIDILSSVFTPIIYVLAASGMLKGILALLVMLNWLQPTDGTYLVWSAAADAVFYFLPVVLSMTAAKKFGANQYVAVLIGLTLLYPSITAIKEAGEALSFFNIPITVATFSGSVFPAIFAVALLAWLEKGLNKILPSMVRNFLTPMFSLMILVPITLMLFGPASAWLSEGLNTLYTALYGFSAGLAGAFVGFFFQIITMLGLHWGLLPITFANLEATGFDTFGAFVAPTIVAQGGAALGVFLKTRNRKLKEIASAASIISFFGISEASMYGTNIRFKRPFFIALATSSVGAMVIGFAGSGGIAFAIPSIMSLPIFMTKNFTIFLLAYFGSFAVAAILTYLFGFSDKMLEEELEEKQEKTNESFIKSPVEGVVVPLSELPDQAFATGAVGRGVAIQATKGQVYAPCNGKVTSLFDSGHAIGITATDGKEILIHIGIDTVKLKGDYFEPKVAVDEEVEAGDLLVKFDAEKVRDAGFRDEVIVVITNLTEHEEVAILEKEHVHVGTPLLDIYLEKEG